MNEFTSEVIRIIKEIPKGKVMSYGQIAICAGNPRAARQVSRILHSMSNTQQLPWHRVINSKGGISLTGQAGFVQASMLSEEGIEVNNKKIDLKKYQVKYM